MSGIAEQPDDEQRDRHQCQPDADKQQLPAEQSRAEGLAFRVVVVRTREQRPRAMARGLAAVGPLVPIPNKTGTGEQAPVDVPVFRNVLDHGGRRLLVKTAAMEAALE